MEDTTRSPNVFIEGKFKAMFNDESFIVSLKFPKMLFSILTGAKDEHNRIEVKGFDLTVYIEEAKEEEIE